MADHLRTSLITEALAAALVTRNPPPGVIFHSDRGCQYTSQEFADFCAHNGVRRSMGRRATCFDNAVAESFFATYKKNSSTPARGMTSPTSNSTHSSGLKATTTDAGDTPRSTT